MGNTNHHESCWTKARPNLLFALTCFSIHRDRKSYFHLKEKAGKTTNGYKNLVDCHSSFLFKPFTIRYPFGTRFNKAMSRLLRRLLPFCSFKFVPDTRSEHVARALLSFLPCVSLIPPFHPFGPPKCQEVVFLSLTLQI